MTSPRPSPLVTVARVLAVALAIGIVAWLVHRAQRGATPSPAEPAVVPADANSRIPEDPVALPSSKFAPVPQGRPLLHSSKTVTLPPSPPPPELLFGSKSGPVPADPQPPPKVEPKKP